MSKKKNYSKMYSAEEEQVTSEEETVVEAEPDMAETPVEEPSPKKKAPETIKGVVANCAKLNVREHPDMKASPLCTIPASSEVKVFADEVYDEWHHVITAEGIEGFCMKQYIKI